MKIYPFEIEEELKNQDIQEAIKEHRFKELEEIENFIHKI